MSDLQREEELVCECCGATEHVLEWPIYERKTLDEWDYTGDAILCSQCYYSYYATPDELNQEREMQELRESDPANW